MRWSRVPVLPALGFLLWMLPAAEGAQAATKIKIGLATPYTAYCLPHLVAKEKGWYKELGLDVEDSIVNGDANATRAMVSGTVDVAVTGPLNVFSAVSNGAPIRWFASWQPTVDYVVVAAPQIKSLKELTDKTFATSGPSGLPQALPTMLFKKLGLSTDKTKFVAVGSHSARLQAVAAGKADGAVVNEMTAALGAESGQTHIIESIGKHFPKLGYIALAAKTSDIADPAKRQVLEQLVRGSIRGARFIMTNPAEATEILQAALKDSNRQVLEKVVRRLNDEKVWGLDGGADPEVANFTAKLEYELGEIKTLLTADQVLEQSIAAAALSKEGPAKF